MSSQQALTAILGCASIGGTSTWKLDRTAYANLYLDDIVLDPRKYERVLEADMIYCTRAGFDSTPYSHAKACRIHGNSYFSRDGKGRAYTKIFDVTKHLNLLFRPPFKGEHRLEPCMCQSNSIGKRVMPPVKALKSARRLVVECLDA